jgi:hypothetical protein
MAKDSDAWKRFRDREDEREQEKDTPSLKERRLLGTPGAKSIEADFKGEGSKAVTDAIRQIEPLIEQVHALYRLYLGGTEKFPPREKRQLLESMMQKFIALPKTNAASKFQAQALQQRFQTQKDQWDRWLRDLEEGRTKRGGK